MKELAEEGKLIEQYNLISPFQIIDNETQELQNNEHLAKFLYSKICSSNKSIQQILVIPDAKQKGYVIAIERVR